jgi:hypothetical protein
MAQKQIKTIDTLEEYSYRTDNLTLPNTEKDWEEFNWKLHFLGGASLIFVHRLVANEKKARRDAEKSNTSDQDNIP